VAVVHSAEPVHITISECIALLREDSKASIDADFASDVAAAVESHREGIGLLCMGVILDTSILITAKRQGSNAR
jgi:hypothetical protein